MVVTNGIQQMFDTLLHLRVVSTVIYPMFALVDLIPKRYDCLDWLQTKQEDLFVPFQSLQISIVTNYNNS